MKLLTSTARVGAGALLVAGFAGLCVAQSAPLSLPPPPAGLTVGEAHLGPPPYDASGDVRLAAMPFDLGPPANEPLGELTTDYYDPPLPPDPDVAFTFTWLASSGANGFGITDFDWNRSWNWCLASHPNPVVITPGFGLHLWAGPRRLDLPPRVYDLYLDLSWRFLERHWWGLTGGLTPGFYGDFNRIDGDTFQLTGWLLGDWTLSERWTAVAGLAYVRQLQSNLLPIGGLIWRPNPDLRIDIVVPRPRVAWFIGGDDAGETWGFVSGVFGGGAWAVDAGDENILVQYSDLRLSIGCERSGPAVVWTAEIGLAFSRDISLDRYTVRTPDSGLFLQAGAEF